MYICIMYPWQTAEAEGLVLSPVQGLEERGGVDLGEVLTGLIQFLEIVIPPGTPGDGPE